MSKVLVASQLPQRLNAMFAEAAPNAEIVPINTGEAVVPLNAEVMIAAPFASAGQPMPMAPPSGWPFDLRWIQLVTVGLDFYPPWLLDPLPVVAGVGRASRHLAEFAFAAVLAGAKRFPSTWVVSAEEWAERPSISGIEGTTLGLFGFGGLGSAIVPWAQAMGMRVAGVRRSDRPLGSGVERVNDIGALFEISDHVVLAVPATPETNGIVNRTTLERARPGCHLINIARGSLVDNEALLEALESGRIARATLDVTHPEPLPAGHPFYSHPRIFLSPHLATNAPDHLWSIARQFAVNLDRYNAGRPLLDQVIGRT